MTNNELQLIWNDLEKKGVMFDLLILDAVCTCFGDITEGDRDNLISVMTDLYLKDENDTSIYKLSEMVDAYMMEEDLTTNDLFGMPPRELLCKVYAYA